MVVHTYEERTDKGVTEQDPEWATCGPMRAKDERKGPCSPCLKAVPVPMTKPIPIVPPNAIIEIYVRS